MHDTENKAPQGAARGRCALSPEETLTSATRDITSFLVMDILERAAAMERQGARVIHMEVGEPDFDTPPAVTEAAVKALRDGKTHYTHSQGLIELREAICGHYHEEYGVEVSPERVFVTNGTSPAMFVAFGALIEPGDEVIVSDPSYACYPNFIRFANGRVVRIRVYEEDGFQFKPESFGFSLNEWTRAIVLNSPANPTGCLTDLERMRAIAETGRPIVSDEIYHGLVYQGREHTILEVTDNAFVLNGFSKLHAMTGLRLGYLIAPEPYAPCLKKLCQNFFISANSVSQWAGIAALTQCHAEIAHMKAVYNKRRIFMVNRLRELGFSIAVEPTGAFYVLAGAKHLAKRFRGSSLKLALDILDKAHVGVTPGIDFGPGAEGYLRFSYANSLENLREGLLRLERYLAEHHAD